ncbi:MAG: peptidase S58 family protein, partial [Chloroflexi bacterium]|nr:peptidase S58 family protein [Chloroflexota bacterium]
ISLPPEGEAAEPLQPGDTVALGQAAAEVVAEAIVRGVRAATALHGIPAVGE